MACRFVPVVTAFYDPHRGVGVFVIDEDPAITHGHVLHRGEIHPGITGVVRLWISAERS